VREEADNTIIERPWEYELVEFCYRRPEDEGEPYLDIVLQKGKEKRRLRFFSPRDIRISGGPSPSAVGLTILDVRNRQMDVLGFELKAMKHRMGLHNSGHAQWKKSIQGRNSTTKCS